MVGVTAVTADAWAGLTRAVVHVVVMGWMFGGVGWHATSKGALLSCELDYSISFWLGMLSWKYPYFVEISTFHGYYLHFMNISVFCGYYLHFVEISTFRGYNPYLVEISTSVDIICISWILSALVTIWST